MSAIITTKCRIHDARSFIQSLGNTSAQFINSIYLFIGRTLPWTTNDGPGASDSVPPFPLNTVSGDIKVWDNIIHLKKISESDCSLVIKRYDWKQDIIYTQYDQDIDLFDSTLGLTPFYVITDDLNVYKCLFNFKNKPSFDKPTGTSTNIITTGDGYQWKYMFTVSSTDAEKFLTNEWIPVKLLLVSDGSKQWDVQQNAQNGSIDVIEIQNEGFGYITIPSVSIVGDGTGASAVVQITGGQVSKINITNRGKNYTHASVTVPGGQVTSINITNNGSGYLSVPSVVISGDGFGATAHAIVMGGQVTSIVIDLPGTGYTTASVSIAPSPGVTATANAVVSGGVVLKAIISPPGGHGSDPVSELGGFFAMLNGKLNFDENGKFSISNDFRTLGLLLNPDLAGTKTTGSGLLYTMAFSLSLTSVTSSFQPDDLISGSISLATGVVLDYNATTHVLRVVNSQGVFVPGEVIATAGNTHQGTLQTVTGTAQGSGTLQITLNAGDTGATDVYKGSTIKILTGPGAGEIRTITTNDGTSKIATIASPDWVVPPTSSSTYSIAKIGYPELQKDTGYILYIENRKPLQRANLQIESISPVVEF